MGIDPGVVRAWLRREHPRPPGERGRLYDELPGAVIDAAREYFIGFPAILRSLATHRPVAGPTREASDESYVVDLCDEMLGERGLRQHRFDWLLGDAGRRGPVRLPGDAYYPKVGLVIEYRERQHDEPVPFMDKQDTISGVKRGEQRREYDHRREQLIPEHGLRLIVTRPSDVRDDSRGRLRRDDRQADLEAMRGVLDLNSHDS